MSCDIMKIAIKRREKTTKADMIFDFIVLNMATFQFRHLFQNHQNIVRQKNRITIKKETL